MRPVRRWAGWFPFGAVLAGMLLPTPVSAAEPIRILASGSLAAVMPRLVEGAGIGPAQVVSGPPAALAERLRGGEAADLFASADMRQPQAVLAGRGGTAVPFARNRMCLLAPERLGVSAANALDRMLAPELRLAASTSGTDIAGDYARAVFARAEALRPGAEDALIAKARPLLGSGAPMPSQPGRGPVASIFLNDAADLLLYYCSGTAATAREVSGLESVALPESLEVNPVYGLALLSDRPEAARLVLFMLSDQGQATLAAAGLLPLAVR